MGVVRWRLRCVLVALGLVALAGFHSANVEKRRSRGASARGLFPQPQRDREGTGVVRESENAKLYNSYFIHSFPLIPTTLGGVQLFHRFIQVFLAVTVGLGLPLGLWIVW